MNTKNKYSFLNINTQKYDWGARTFQKIEGALGLNIKAHGDNVKQTCEEGQIFLFNHFARFETVIPPYIIHREIGAYTRSVADKSLFAGNGSFAKLLREVGAVPNDLPGLLPFLAAEILRGKKVVIFPEGGMIKDRRITDDAGRLGIFSQQSNVFRKHHRGAAVLALTLELFKGRILTNFKRGNEARIEHWQKSLGLSRDALYQAALKPTLIVPGAITFCPIHIDDNIISRGISLLMKNPSVRMLEEVLIETNIIFKKTDMDVKFGDSISARHTWHWWEKFLLSRYFKKIHSLDAFFGMRETADRWTEKLLVRLMSKEADRIRDAYMKGIYNNVMVNLAHLSSTLLIHLAHKGFTQIQKQDFHKALYLAVKDLHNMPHISLHRSLIWPDRYMGLPDNDCEDLNRFIKTCEHAGLLEVTKTHYILKKSLTDDVDYHQVRLNNPAIVNSNEVAHFKEVKQSITDACKQLSSKQVSQTAMASMLFDDELRSFKWNRQHYWRQKYAAINSKEKASQSGAPFLLVNEAKNSGKKVGILLIHGFLSSPASLKSYGQKLHKKGYTVMGVRLAGHGTSPHDLNEKSSEDWLKSVRRGYKILSSFVDEIVIVGFSTGGALSLAFAKENPPKLAGVASISTPLKIQDRKIALVPFVHGLNKVADWIPGFTGGVRQFVDNDSATPDISYMSNSIHALYELKQLMAYLRRNLKNIKTPTLIMQGDEDDVVRPSSATSIYKLLGAKEKRLEWIKTKEHNLLAKNIGETHNLIERFINDVTNVKLIGNTPIPLVDKTPKPAEKQK